MKDALRIQQLAATHDRGDFSCGIEPLDQYFRERVSQDIRKGIANCFVGVNEGGRVVAFYTLSASSIAAIEIPAETTKTLPRYPILPAALIGRLAVQSDVRGQGVGGALLVDAVERARRAEAAVFALTVDAKDEAAAAFYKHFGFRPFRTNPTRLFLPVHRTLPVRPDKPGA